jgi:hypothetical protein
MFANQNESTIFDETKEIMKSENTVNIICEGLYSYNAQWPLMFIHSLTGSKIICYNSEGQLVEIPVKSIVKIDGSSF